MSLLPVVVVDDTPEHGEEHGQLEEDGVHQDTGGLAVENSNDALGPLFVLILIYRAALLPAGGRQSR